MNEQSWTDSEIDRSTWGPGPWDGEPDKVQWKDEKTGLDCLAKRSSFSGNWCGYVGLPPGHRFHGKDYDDVRFDGEDPYPDVHGGLTYADGCQHSTDPAKGICHIPAPGEPDALWWLGFDCHHSMDLAPAYEARNEERGWGRDYDKRYRTLGYVKAECAKLAAQLVA